MNQDKDQATIHPDAEKSESPGTLPRGTNLGRFVVLEELGSGGMGVVYAAYDSVLDRKVAVKLLRSETSGEAAAVRQDRLMREARAMAQLAHPNVNTVFDVGTYRGQVFVAMELIDGVTLTQWTQAERRSWQEILEVFLQAGQGLAAAHRAGLVHRDVKPDNLLIGKDGRVRVTDFGLVSSSSEEEGPPAKSKEPPPVMRGESESLTRTGAVMGSPAYMSPEQHRGESVSESSDQFSFSVALFEALFGGRPFEGETGEQLVSNVTEGRIQTESKAASVPAWLRQTVLRGLKPDPAERYPSMDAMLQALQSDPARKRFVRIAWAGVVLALALGVWGLVKGLTTQATSACQNLERHLVGVWDAGRKQAVKTAFLESKRPYARETFEQVQSRLDAYTGAWTAASRNNCEATHVHGDQTDTDFDLRKQCLDRRLSELDALVKIFAEKGDSALLDKAVQATFELTPLSICADMEFLKARVPLPENPSRRKEVEGLRTRMDAAEALARVGRHKEALEQAETIAAEAMKLDYALIRAEAMLLLGDLQSNTKEIAAAEKTLEESGQAAARARDDHLQAKILTKLIYLVGNLSDRRVEALALEPAAGMAVTRAGDDPLLRANLINAIGVVLDSDGKAKEAEERHRKALDLFRKVYGDEHPRVASCHDNIGVTLREQGKYDQAIEEYKKAHAIREKFLDPRHPDMGNSLNNLGVVYDDKGDDEKAIEHYRRALTIWTNSLGTDNPRAAMATNNIGGLYNKHADYEKALDYFQQSLDIRIRLLGEKHQYTLRVRENIAIVHESQGKFDQAFSEFKEILALNEEVLGADHPGVAFSSNRVGNCYLRRGEYDKAIEAYQRALAIYEKAQGSENISLAEPLNNLARTYAKTGKIKLARAHVDRALAIAIKTLGEDHPGVAETNITQGQVLRLEGHPRKALAILEKALSVLEEKVGKDSLPAKACRAELKETRKALSGAGKPGR